MEVVVWLCFAPLLWFLGKCHGQTQFIYKDWYKSEISCEGNKWKVSTKSIKIDPQRLVQCDRIRIDLDVDDNLEFCSNKPPQSKCVCILVVKSGFVACVKSLDSGLLFPFKPSPNVVSSYIVAAPNPLITSTPEETSSLTVPEGESVSLKCSFTFTREYNGVPFVVYWIKTVGESSTCVYSYDYSKHRSPQYGHHCAVQKDLLNRLSNPTEGQNSHNIRISEVMESDSGQYLCAVQVDPINKNTAKGNWKVIKRVTVSVHKDKRPQPTRTTVTPTTTEKTTKKATEKTTKKATEKTTKKATEKTTKKATENVSGVHPLMPLFTSWPICLGLLLSVWIAFALIRKKASTARGDPPDLRLCRYKASKVEKQLLILMVLRMLWDVVRRRTRIHEEFYQEDPDHEESTTSVDLHAAARLNDGSGASEDTKHIHDEDYLLFLKG
ncbi:uncharacterized protein LOC108416270 [Pygocentrus nattereri]|uniref:uncharacterized protein LOC108416270 n=1 Tax=Pygocentrus nattereri TaxID=42514 RepID=UPI001890CD93|nr:uncharacterized protein LOC108416270 [Pygocentrus nattereri]